MHNGHEVTLAVGEEFRPTEHEVYDFEVLFFKAKFKKLLPPTVLPYSSEMKNYLKHNHQKFDLVISSEVFMFQSLYAARICPEKTIIWHELALHQRKFHKIPSKFWYNIVARFLMSKVRIVIPRSVDSQKFILQYMNNVSDEYVEHGININELTQSRDKDDYVVYIGQLIVRKNIPSILAKFAEYIKDGSPLKLKLIGRGALEKELKMICSKLNIDDSVDFLGFMTHKQMNGVLNKAKAMLIDTKQDNNMVSIPESIVCGTPVLTNTIPTNSCTIAQNKLGIAKDNWNAMDLKEIIDNNKMYVDNCIAFRDNLSIDHQAGELIRIAQTCISTLSYVKHR